MKEDNTVKIYAYSADWRFIDKLNKLEEDTFRQMFPRLNLLCEDEHQKRQDELERAYDQLKTQAWRDHTSALQAHYDVLGATGVAGDF